MDVETNLPSSIAPDWFGLGTNECYGKTCQFGEFCSKDMLYQACRQCSDIIAWCDVNRTHLALKYPSCYHICAVATEPTLDILHFLLIGLVAFLFLMLLVVCLCSLKKRRTPQKGLQRFPGQKGEHTTLKAPESRVLLPPDVERNEVQQPTTPNNNPPPYTKTKVATLQEDTEDINPQGRETPEPSAPTQYDTVSTGDSTTTSSSNSNVSIQNDLGEASTAEKHAWPLAGGGIPASGFGGGYSVYPIKAKDELEMCPKLALGSQTFNADVCFGSR
ncbi:uncharacterized protein [Littorina saxatilis]|uniref:uncharacterized protein isoform X2 n=1 Tax=Littorina saxatilis TaxID=31220 RepID=UPI0038B62261